MPSVSSAEHEVLKQRPGVSQVNSFGPGERGDIHHALGGLHALLSSACSGEHCHELDANSGQSLRREEHCTLTLLASFRLLCTYPALLGGDTSPEDLTWPEHLSP